ncbi:hypothetical protein Pelo_11739 [Pelomyxa schiedti]|nr:hypothetical protein Pelo_11739 [Pelomyxa schiedti]
MEALLAGTHIGRCGASSPARLIPPGVLWADISKSWVTATCKLACLAVHNAEAVDMSPYALPPRAAAAAAAADQQQQGAEAQADDAGYYVCFGVSFTLGVTRAPWVMRRGAAKLGGWQGDVVGWAGSGRLLCLGDLIDPLYHPYLAFVLAPPHSSACNCKWVVRYTGLAALHIWRVPVDGSSGTGTGSGNQTPMGKEVEIPIMGVAGDCRVHNFTGPTSDLVSLSILYSSTVTFMTVDLEETLRLKRVVTTQKFMWDTGRPCATWGILLGKGGIPHPVFLHGTNGSVYSIDPQLEPPFRRLQGDVMSLRLFGQSHYGVMFNRLDHLFTYGIDNPRHPSYVGTTPLYGVIPSSEDLVVTSPPVCNVVDVSLGVTILKLVLCEHHTIDQFTVSWV